MDETLVVCKVHWVYLMIFIIRPHLALLICHSISMMKFLCSFPSPRPSPQPKLPFCLSTAQASRFRPILLLSASERVRPSVGHSLHILASLRFDDALVLDRVLHRRPHRAHSSERTDPRVYNRNLSPIPLISPSAPVPIRRRIAPSTTSLHPCLVPDHDGCSPGPTFTASSALNNLVPVIIPTTPTLGRSLGRLRPFLEVSLSSDSSLPSVSLSKLRCDSGSRSSSSSRRL